jgi:hypothetical protein
MALDRDDLARLLGARRRPCAVRRAADVAAGLPLMSSADALGAGHHMRRGARAPAALVVLMVVAVLLAGCGGSSGLTVASMPGVSTPGRHVSSSRSSGGGAVRFVGGAPSPAQRAGAQVTQLRFSRCMRSHGVPGFPDPPSASGGGFGFAFGGSGIDPGAPLFREAQRACISILTHQRVFVQ